MGRDLWGLKKGTEEWVNSAHEGWCSPPPAFIPGISASGQLNVFSFGVGKPEELQDARNGPRGSFSHIFVCERQSFAWWFLVALVEDSEFFLNRLPSVSKQAESGVPIAKPVHELQASEVSLIGSLWVAAEDYISLLLQQRQIVGRRDDMLLEKNIGIRPLVEEKARSSPHPSGFRAVQETLADLRSSLSPLNHQCNTAARRR